MCQVIEKNIKSDISQINSIVSDLIYSIEKKISDDHIFNLKLILSELIINSIKHGNNNDKEKNIIVSLVITDDWIEVSVCDEGNGFMYAKNLNPSNYSESGRGLLLVEGLSDQFIVCNNTIKCIKYIN